LGTTDGGEEKRTNLQNHQQKKDMNFACAQQVQNDNSRTVLLDCESSIHSHNFYLRPFKKLKPATYLELPGQNALNLS